MIKQIVLTATLAVFCGSFALNSSAQGNPAIGKPEIAAAANKFLASLDDAQRAKAVYDFKDEAQRKRWSNLPPTMVKRGGLRMGDLTQPQREAVRALLAAASRRRKWPI
jgi:hypothetical protein